jgi:hypothetical protein
VLVVHLAGHGRDRDVLQPDAGEGGARGSITRKKDRNRERRLIIFYFANPAQILQEKN